MQQTISEPPLAELLTSQGVAALRAGATAQAHELLRRATEADPNSVQAWLWLSGAVASNAERRHCLEQVLVLDPQHQAAIWGLAQLPSEPATAFTPPVQTMVTAAEQATATAIAAVLVPPEMELEMIAEPPPPSSAKPAAAAPPAYNFEASSEAQEAINFMIVELGKHTGRDAAIRAVTEHYGSSWHEAEHLVQYVENEHSTRVAVRQSPLLLFFGIGALILGCILIIIGGGSLLSGRISGRGVEALITGLMMVAGSVTGLWQTIRAMWR